ncbi:uncharacterized protein LOC141682461 [Apium graveolens]|uniref:uncharacterized protein LOC141682461 n=1 Tax=Apium graveolens TaxID=4045 RepID=UPI003D7AE017
MELSNDVRAIGICGMGGIGKTTTAKAFYNKYYTNFDSCCFIENVKQFSVEGSPLLPILQQLLIAFLSRKDYKVHDVDSGLRQLEQILCSKKALVVLDDLDQSSYLEFLVEHCNLFSAGSRIVITTRDVHLLNQLEIDSLIDVDVYMVKKLGKLDSLDLFNYHAFGKVTPPASLRVLSESYITYAGGLPLALKLLGSLLRGRTLPQDEVFWKDILQKVRKNPENKILKILQVSYNELDDVTLKSLFLDIAFFFVRKYKFEAVDIFNACGYHPDSEIKILLERCLLTLDKNNMFHMHDLIQDMGRGISKSTRLFLRENAWDHLQNQNQKELDKIEGLILDLTWSMEKQINSQVFERLPKLRLLEMRDVHGMEGHFENSFHELRCIRWNYCTWTELPSSFRPKKLVSIDMPFNKLKILWDDARPFMNLKMINVNYSVNLKTTPNFGNSKSINKLFFRGCESLLKVHPSIRELTGLDVLDLTECIKMKVSAETLGLSSELRCLYLGYCGNLKQLPKQLGGMKWLKELDASHTAITELPDSITQLKELVYLKLDGCKKLKKLPEQFGNMVGLRIFCAVFSAIEQLPDSSVGLINLESLDLKGCKNLRNLPNSLWKLESLRVLDLGMCSKLKRLPNELEKMQCLEELNASSTGIEEVPDSVGLLSRLRVLNLANCNKLKCLPDSVWNLTSLTHLNIFQENIDRINLPEKVKDTKLVALSLYCDVILWLPVILSFFSLKQLVLRDVGESSGLTKPFSLSKLYNLQHLSLYNCKYFGSSFPELPLSMRHLNLHRHATLVHLPDLSGLKKLRKLGINRYTSLQSLPPLPPHLQSLRIYECTSLTHLSDMSMLNELSDLQFGKLKSLGSIKSLPVSIHNLLIGLLLVIDVRKHFLPFYKVEVPKIADWFSYKSSGRTVSFDIPTLSADKFLGLALSVLFTSKSNRHNYSMKADVTNITNGTTRSCLIPVFAGIKGEEVYYVVKCIRGDFISMRSGDRIKILLQRQLYNLGGDEVVGYEGGKVEMFAAHVIKKTSSTPDFPSVLEDLINSFYPRANKLTRCLCLCWLLFILWYHFILILNLF